MSWGCRTLSEPNTGFTLVSMTGGLAVAPAHVDQQRPHLGGSNLRPLYMVVGPRAHRCRFGVRLAASDECSCGRLPPGQRLHYSPLVFLGRS